MNTYKKHRGRWDADGNSITIDSVGSTFDALDRMIEQNRSGTYTEIVYAPAGGKLALMSGTNGQTLQKAFIALPGQDTAVYTSSGLDHYRHSDWLGSSRLTSTPSRTVASTVAYAPFGETYAQYGTPDVSFTGQNQDTVSGDYDFLFREYSTEGRWPSPDPAGLGAVNPINPQSWNRYAYVLNNPLGFVDPLGMYCQWDDGTSDNVGDSPEGSSGEACQNAGGTWVAICGVDTICVNTNGSNDSAGPQPDPTFDPSNGGIDLSGNTSAANNGLLSKLKSLANNPCVTSALGKGALSVGVDAIGLIPEAGGVVRVIGHQAGFVGVVADQAGSRVIKAVGASTSTVQGLNGLFDTSSQGLISTGLTVAGFIPGLGQLAAGASIVNDAIKTGIEIAQCHP